MKFRGMGFVWRRRHDKSTSYSRGQRPRARVAETRALRKLRSYRYVAITRRCWAAQRGQRGVFCWFFVQTETMTRQQSRLGQLPLPSPIDEEHMGLSLTRSRAHLVLPRTHTHQASARTEYKSAQYLRKMFLARSPRDPPYPQLTYCGTPENHPHRHTQRATFPQRSRRERERANHGRRWGSYRGEAGVHAIMRGCFWHEGRHGENGTQPHRDCRAPHQGKGVYLKG